MMAGTPDDKVTVEVISRLLGEEPTPPTPSELQHRRNAEAAREHAAATRAVKMEQQSLNNTLLAVNMSMLGVMFGYQNITKALRSGKDAELAELQLKEDKTEADKERIKILRKEAIEQRKLNTRIMAFISVAQLMMSVMQIINTLKLRSVVVTSANTAATAAETGVKGANAKATMGQGFAEMWRNIMKSGWLAPAMIAVLAATAFAGFGLYKAAQARAEKGAVIPPTKGGINVLMGEGGEVELATPEPMLRTIIREETGGAEGRGVTVNNYIQAMDVESFNEFRARSNESLEFMGVN